MPNIFADEAVRDLLAWVDNNNIDLQEDGDDLAELYGDDDVDFLNENHVTV